MTQATQKAASPIYTPTPNSPGSAESLAQTVEHWFG